uniref:Uncharacterized protein n=1 Tax=Meloidogyne enterolobii TaxID=390850 RepID=A0A6V7X8I2_MELEN|nr:unnamed protein product [Meloidogyne enterolobii]
MIFFFQRFDCWIYTKFIKKCIFLLNIETFKVLKEKTRESIFLKEQVDHLNKKNIFKYT